MSDSETDTEAEATPDAESAPEAPESPSEPAEPSIDVSVYLAKIETLETALNVALNENVALKAVNYDLLVSTGNSEPVDNTSTDDIDAPSINELLYADEDN